LVIEEANVDQTKGSIFLYDPFLAFGFNISSKGLLSRCAAFSIAILAGIRALAAADEISQVKFLISVEIHHNAQSFSFVTCQTFN